jgi:predicted ATPase
VVQATVVDHVMPHRGDQRLFWDEANWGADVRARRTGERWFEAGLERLIGDVLATVARAEEAEASFLRAMAVAASRTRNCGSCAPRTASPGCGPSRASGRRPRDLLALLYDWFTEGFDTPDLEEAKVLLDALA